jgi:2-oxoisovalerate dehydrogenase E1 component
MIAAQELAAAGFSVEVIDLRTIVPFDREHVFESVRKTGRVLIAHEDLLFGGFGGEIAAQIAQDCFTDLDAPIKRVGMKYAAAVPHSPILEEVVLPQQQDITLALKELLEF